MNNLSINIFELSFYQNESKWKHELLLFEIIKTNLHRVVGQITSKNHFVLIGNSKKPLDKDGSIFECGRCWKSYTNQNVIINHSQRCEKQKVMSIRTSNETHLKKESFS